ncbi:MAG: DUF1175 family protein [Acidobacteriaceae bacterium]
MSFLPKRTPGSSLDAPAVSFAGHRWPWRPILLVGSLAAIVLLAGFLAIFSRQRLVIEPTQITLPADGAEHQALHLRPLVSWLASAGSVTQEAGPKLRLLQTRDSRGRTVWQGLLVSPVTTGRTQLRLRWNRHTVQVPVNFVFDSNDSYGDGTPDFLLLHTIEDRRAFRSWFVSIAEAQADRRPLPAEIDDCAALLRFAYREALRFHDENWLASYPADAGLSSVRQYQYPHTPLGANLFRIRAGPFLGADLSNGSFAQFADARTLMVFNAHLIGRDLRLARPGDLIFYRQLDLNSPYDVPGATRYHSPFHSMIFCGEHGVVYHTGPIHQGKGEMRRLLTTDLLHYPDARWRPIPENTNFLGVYRWNILREDD